MGVRLDLVDQVSQIQEDLEDLYDHLGWCIDNPGNDWDDLQDTRESVGRILERYFNVKTAS